MRETTNILLILVWQYYHANAIILINCAYSEADYENDEHSTQVTAQIACTLPGNKSECPSYCVIM
jgi:hypothetical protein